MEKNVVYVVKPLFIKCKDGPTYFGLCPATLKQRAAEAQAIHKVGKTVLVKVSTLEKYLDLFIE
ncbi:MAG: DUF6462 family protein [Butyrivibrio sp.]|jgi:hypothetical protein|nr:DUF6462 family protein [Butyrivibrio sp.]